MNATLVPAGEDVVSEEIDGEVIIVNLNNGNYYSLTQSAAVVWSGIQTGATVEQLQDLLASHYSGEPSVMNQSLADLVQALETEQLVARSNGAGVVPGAVASAFADDPARQKQVFQPPTFERFTDMEDLLLLDPVHEAEDEKGWPHAKDGA